MTYVFFVLGIGLLIKGANWLVDGSSSLARKFGVPSLIIGLTIVAFGTSTPELLVNIFAAFSGATDIAFGNVIGSNLANTLLILGVIALISPPIVKRSTVWKEIPFSLLAVVVLLIVANDLVLDGINISALTRVDGLVMLLFFTIFIYYVFIAARDVSLKDKKLRVKRRSGGSILTLIVLGLVSLFLGGMWVVNGAIAIAEVLGASEFLIAATIVAFGTSLPELATVIVATRKGDTDLAIGNVVGSNIFNIFWILGITSLIAPVKIPSTINFDILFLTSVTLLLFLFMFVGERHKLSRRQGILFILLYVGYIGFIIMRG